MFGLFKRKKKEAENRIRSSIKNIRQARNYIFTPNDLKGIKEYEDFKNLEENEQKKLILELIEEYIHIKGEKGKLKNPNSVNPESYYYASDNIIEAILHGLLRKKLNYNEKEWIELFNTYKDLASLLVLHSNQYYHLGNIPFKYSIKQLEYYLSENAPSENLIAYIDQILLWEAFKSAKDKGYYGKEMVKISHQLIALKNSLVDQKEFKLQSNDIGEPVNQLIKGLTEHKESYFRIFDLALNISGARPGKKFINELSQELDTIGLDQFRNTVHEILKITIAFKPYTKVTTYEYDKKTYQYEELLFLSELSQNFIKGLVWSCHRFSDKETISILSDLAVKSYASIPGKGPAATSVGNACVNLLGSMRGKDGLGALSRLKLKVSQNNVKKNIDKLLEKGAEKYNVSVEELKEMSVPEFGLIAGIKDYHFEDYLLRASLLDLKLTQQWIKSDGSPIKSVPSSIKANQKLADYLKEVRKELKEIQKVFSAQKQRIDNQFILDREMEYDTFKKYYLDHGLIHPITTKLIWSFTRDNKSEDAIFENGLWKNLENQTVGWIGEQTKVKLWHPINSDEATILNWRKMIISLKWKQPTKQAYREIYLLTDAELETKSYSNRMAAHILKQHQFNSLAGLRDWKYSLMGAYDDGRSNETCSKTLKEYGIKVEFWIDELNQEGAYNDAGIWNYVATDQVRFLDNNSNGIDLILVPKLVFSEIMRDIDLFVGVSSVGNDPEWMDKNGERQSYRDYWQSYSFGDLNEIAKTRKEILIGLLPRLTKIRDKATIEGKFMIIKGQLRTYKIHIGSGNILMEPNNQYLCIVPARSSNDTLKTQFIPFEGDRGLSIVLSKAFLLAEDDKITDGTITSQINIGR